MDEPLVYTVAEVSELLKISKYSVRRLIKSRELVAIFVAGRWLLPRAQLLRWLHWRIDPDLYEPE